MRSLVFSAIQNTKYLSSLLKYLPSAIYTMSCIWVPERLYRASRAWLIFSLTYTINLSYFSYQSKKMNILDLYWICTFFFNINIMYSQFHDFLSSIHLVYQVHWPLVQNSRDESVMSKSIGDCSAIKYTWNQQPHPLINHKYFTDVGTWFFKIIISFGKNATSSKRSIYKPYGHCIKIREQISSILYAYCMIRFTVHVTIVSITH